MPALDFFPPMTKIIYQCLVCNRVHQTLEAAENCHKGPTQTVEQGLTGFKKRRGIIGN
jgi:hypothetical protein